MTAKHRLRVIAAAALLACVSHASAQPRTTHGEDFRQRLPHEPGDLAQGGV